MGISFPVLSLGRKEKKPDSSMEWDLTLAREVVTPQKLASSFASFLGLKPTNKLHYSTLQHQQWPSLPPVMFARTLIQKVADLLQQERLATAASRFSVFVAADKNGEWLSVEREGDRLVTDGHTHVLESTTTLYDGGHHTKYSMEQRSWFVQPQLLVVIRADAVQKEEVKTNAT